MTIEGKPPMKEMTPKKAYEVITEWMQTAPDIIVNFNDKDIQSPPEISGQQIIAIRNYLATKFKDKKCSQTTFGKLLHVSRGTINNWENEYKNVQDKVIRPKGIHRQVMLQYINHYQSMVLVTKKQRTIKIPLK